MKANEGKRKFNKRAKLIFGLLIFIFSLYFSLVEGLFFMDMPPRSDIFDCDDAALFVFERFENFGQEDRLTIVAGNLKIDEEEYGEIDHVWLLVSFGPFSIPIDWKQVRYGGQYYEGYKINKQQLTSFVKQDFEQKNLLAAGDGLGK